MLTSLTQLVFSTLDHHVDQQCASNNNSYLFDLSGSLLENVIGDKFL